MKCSSCGNYLEFYRYYCETCDADWLEVEEDRDRLLDVCKLLNEIIGDENSVRHSLEAVCPEAIDTLRDAILNTVKREMI